MIAGQGLLVWQKGVVRNEFGEASQYRATYDFGDSNRIDHREQPWVRGRSARYYRTLLFLLLIDVRPKMPPLVWIITAPITYISFNSSSYQVQVPLNNCHASEYTESICALDAVLTKEG